MIRSIPIIILSLIVVVLVFGIADYTCYSGAPGTQGTCAGTCHGSSNGTIIVQGFPTSYVPGQTYVITVKHTSGSKISNFNASARNTTNNKRVGTITAGYQTSLYNVAAESNGVHLTSSSKDSGKFNWTAPEHAVANIKLYLAGMQGSSASGANTVITIASSPAQGQAEGYTNPTTYLTIIAKPLIITESMPLELEITIPSKKTAQLRIIQVDGRIVNTIQIPSSASPKQTITWRPLDQDGNNLPNGSYFASLACETEQVIKKFVISNK